MSTMPTFFTIVVIIVRLQICESSNRGQNDKSYNIDSTSNKTDGNPCLCSLVAGLGLIIQIGLQRVICSQHCAIVKIVRFGRINNGDNTTNEAAEQRTDNRQGHLIAMRG